VFFRLNNGYFSSCVSLLALGTLLSPLVWAQQAPALILPPLSAGVADNLRAHLGILTQTCDTSLVRLQRLLPQARADAEAALKAMGYYSPTMNLAVEPLEGCWGLDLALDPGAPVMLAAVEIRVSGVPESSEMFDTLIDASPMKSGTPLHHGEYEALKSALSSKAVEEGYFDARFERAEIALDLVDNTADISLTFDPGPRYRFGAIDLKQDGRLSEALVSGLMPVSRGDPYSSDTLALLRKKLDESQYFRQIQVLPHLGRNAEHEVPVEVTLDLRPRHAWSGGLGFTTDTGPRARTGYQNRFVNMRGHKAGADASISTVRSLVDGSYSIPLADAARQSLNFGLGYSFENNDSFESKRTKFESSLRSETDSGWQQSLFVDIQSDAYIVGRQEDVSFLSMLGMSISKTRADDLINTRAGWKLFAQIRGASDALLSDASFIQGAASAKHILSICRGRFLNRIEVGATWIDQTQSLPATLRYFAGGDQSIRGFDFRSLGPLDSNGEVAGGRNLLVVSSEYDFQVRQNWRVAVFTDAGNAFDTTGDMKFRQSVGMGLRWISPIGPVRVDLAHPLNAQESVRLHITMGPDL